MSDKPVAYMFDWQCKKDDISISHPFELQLKGVCDVSNIRHLYSAAAYEKQTKLFNEAIDRIRDLLANDDGQAYKEARKFLERVEAAQAQQESLDAKRLDFVLSKTAFIEVVRFDDTFNRYKLMSQNEDEEFFCLHDENKSFSTEREAIDAAMLFIPPAPEVKE